MDALGRVLKQGEQGRTLGALGRQSHIARNPNTELLIGVKHVNRRDIGTNVTRKSSPRVAETSHTKSIERRRFFLPSTHIERLNDNEGNDYGNTNNQREACFA